MSSLFDPITVGGLSLANRIAMAPLTRNRSPGAVPNDLNVIYYEQRATAGLIITEGTAITPQAQGYADVPGLYRPQSIAGWKNVTEAVHRAGGKIVTQIWHVGRISHTSLQPDGGAPVAPSAKVAKSKTFIIDPDGSGAFVETSTPRALEVSELEGILDDYRTAARAAVDAGFDGVEIHAANGYLIDQFLRSGANERTDAYGGSIENRARFAVEVVKAVTEAIGAERTGIRISPVTPANDISDPNPQPLFDHLVTRLAEFDLAFIHVVQGATGGDRNFQQGESPFDWDGLRETYRNAGGKGAWMVNNGYTRDEAEAAIANGKADIVAFGRPFISNPDLVRRFREDLPLAQANSATFYGGGATGYTDYPSVE